MYLSMHLQINKFGRMLTMLS
uniref:Uncharacterized protein n=1 Tax=Arundo donax TaxID=35708 RepID=A0A0A9BY50_ARUDO